MIQIEEIFAKYARSKIYLTKFGSTKGVIIFVTDQFLKKYWDIPKSFYIVRDKNLLSNATSTHSLIEILQIREEC